MPITSSAKKALRVSKRKYLFNQKRKRTTFSVVKKINKLLAAGSGVEALKLYPELQKALDKSAKRGTISQNTASRRKARTLARIRSLAKK